MDAFADAAPAGPERKINLRWGVLAICALTGAVGLYMLTRQSHSKNATASVNTASNAASAAAPGKPEVNAPGASVSAQPGSLVTAGNTAGGAKVSSALNASNTQPELPKATRGPEAIVRYARPDAEGVLLLEKGKAQEALAWAEAHKVEPLKARALVALGRFDEAANAFKQCGNSSDLLFGTALCAAKGNAEAIPDEQLKNALDAQKRLPTEKKYTAIAWGEARAAYETARRLSQSKFQRGDEAARPLFQDAYLSKQLEEPLEKECFAKLNELTANLILNPKRVTSEPKTVVYKVAAGDSISKIAKKFNVSPAQLTRLNKLDPKAALYIGKPLKVLPGTAELLVDRWRLTATLLIDGVYIHQYPVGIGPGENTPTGEFTIRTKLVNPDWWYAGKKIPFGQPENILGTRWMGFDREEGGGKAAGIGVHGTGIPESVPGRESKGCVRMRNEDVEELYDFLPQGGVVRIGE